MGLSRSHPALIEPEAAYIRARKDAVVAMVEQLSEESVTFWDPNDQNEKLHIGQVSPGGCYIMDSNDQIVRSILPENYYALVNTVVSGLRRGVFGWHWKDSLLYDYSYLVLHTGYTVSQIRTEGASWCFLNRKRSAESWK